MLVALCHSSIINWTNLKCCIFEIYTEGCHKALDHLPMHMQLWRVTIKYQQVCHLVTAVTCSQGWWIQNSKETFWSFPNTTTNDDDGFCGLEYLALNTVTHPNKVVLELGHDQK